MSETINYESTVTQIEDSKINGYAEARSAGPFKSGLDFVNWYLLVRVHFGGVRLRRDILLQRPLDRRHRNVGDAAVVQPLLELVPLRRVRNVVLYINLHGTNTVRDHCK